MRGKEKEQLKTLKPLREANNKLELRNSEQKEKLKGLQSENAKSEFQERA